MPNQKIDKFPSVSVIVVNYNGLKWLGPCFEALLQIKYPKSKLELILVDNHSSDQSVVFMQKNSSTVKILHQTENNYCAANNLGIRKSMDGKIESVGSKV